MTTNVVFACDESGAKGYADQTESYPGEVGVFAGILVPEECDAKTRLEFQSIYEKHKSTDGKLHIADLPPEHQQVLRNDVYAAIRKFKLPSFWYAIHVDGLHDWYLIQKKMLDDAKHAAAADGREPPRIKPRSRRDKPASMHEELFIGLYSHLIAFLEERKQKRLSIEVRTDQIDSPIVTNFHELAERLLSEAPLVTMTTGWDTDAKKVVGSKIEVGFTLPSSLKIEATVERLAINTVREGDGYVLAADVLANSLNHLFKNRTSFELYGPLNHPQAIAAHPLADSLAAFYDWGGGDLIGDRLFSHPKGRRNSITGP